MAKVVILPLPTQGHVNPTLPLARELRAQGEEVIYCLPEPYRASIRSTGATFLSSPLASLQPFRQSSGHQAPLFWLPLHGALASLQLMPRLLKRLQDAPPD